MFKFESLRVYQLALDYVDLVYDVAEKLPRSEQYNLCDQIKRAATSIALNIAEGSTGQSDPEQARFSIDGDSLIARDCCVQAYHRAPKIPEGSAEGIAGTERPKRNTCTRSSGDA